MPLFRALAKNMAASYFGETALRFCNGSYTSVCLYSVTGSSGLWRNHRVSILVPRASRPHASSIGPGTHRTGTARKLALISNAHGN